MALEIETPVRPCGGYDEGERTHDGLLADWEAWVYLKREGKRGLHMHLQFTSEGVAREEAEQMVTDVLAGLNGGAA